MCLVPLESLIENKVYLGHSASSWHARIAPYTRASVRGHYVIDLVATAKLLTHAYAYLFKMAKRGHSFLFVGTKYTAAPWVRKAALCSGSFYVNQVWRSGLLTNWTFLRGRVRLLSWFSRVFLFMREYQYTKPLPKGLVLSLERRYLKLRLEMSGLIGLHYMPNVVILIDPQFEKQAFTESVKLKRIIVALVDSNCDPDLIHVPIPGNDDHSTSIRMILQIIATAILRGKLVRYYLPVSTRRALI